MSEIPPEDRVRVIQPQHTLNISFGSIWTVAAPMVFRYEDEEWIEEFFQSGRLRLSTFKTFKGYEDEVRGDAEEGWGFCYGETPQGKSICVAQEGGENALVLCTSHKLDRKLGEKFGRNSAFQIVNTVGFAMEVARQIPGFMSGFEGSCIYRPSRTINRAIDLDIDSYTLPDGSINMQMMFDAGNLLGGPELFLLKHLSYADQQEYRFLWYTDVDRGPYFDIVVPSAVKYCSRRRAKDIDGATIADV